MSFLPHAVDPEIFRPINGAVKEHDVCFVGNWSPKRQKYIEAVLEVTGNVVIYGGRWLIKTWRNDKLRRCVRGAYTGGEELLSLYNRSRIALNVTNWGFGEGGKRSGMNMRVLEVPACGAFLLTDGSADMGSLVRAGEHVAVYEGIEELRDQVCHYLGHPEEREAIAVAGTGQVRTRYTYDDVVATIIARFHDLPGVE